MRFASLPRSVALGLAALVLAGTASACGAAGTGAASGPAGVGKEAFIAKVKEEAEFKDLLKDIPETVANCMLDSMWDRAKKYDPVKLESFVNGKITMDELSKDDKITAEENIAEGEKCMKATK
ncbi:hypothetical protein [Nonomuraea endophytica]|uniref:hypothetical protein n=1 Tax=Nonomuraea endophytica TaxID=714136 RepID=UPI0037CCC341